MDLHRIANKKLSHTTFWGLVLSCSIVIVVALLGRAALNIRAALTEKPDLAVYLLLPEANIHDVTLLRELPNERDYLAETATGQLLVKLRKVRGEWTLADTEPLR